MISSEYLKQISHKSGLTLYQQEKDYLLKLFLFFYYRRFSTAVFKGGTCIKYLFGSDRFSEDLDFNLRGNPKKFKLEVDSSLKRMNEMGIESRYRKSELFLDSFTCEMNFKGPLFMGKNYSLNKFRIDAGKRMGIILKPKWQVITSEYPETPKKFLVLTLDEREILAEKIIALFSRKLGRDLYDVWYLLKCGIKIDPSLIKRKTKIKFDSLPEKKEYERDMKKLTSNLIPYSQVKDEVEEKLKESRLL